MKRKSSPNRRPNKPVPVSAQIASVSPANVPMPILTAKTLEAHLREKHAALEKLVSNQSLETNPSREKATAKPVAGKAIKPVDGTPAAPVRT